MNLDTFIPVVAGVFAGTLPLLSVIGWAAFTQNARLKRIETNMDELGRDLKNLGIRTHGVETRVSVVETKIDGPRIVAVRP